MNGYAQEIEVDSFAGGGGASHGINKAIGRGPSVAINHNPAAIAMHAANHPRTKHFTEDVFKLSPRVATGGRPVGLLWASPDCTHFSRAKGGKPVAKKIRGLAWSAIKWAAEVSPRVIILENVREFQFWGPLLPRWDCPACEWKGTEGQATLVRRGRRACPRCESRKLRESQNDKTRLPFLVPDPDKLGLTFKQFVGRLKALGYVVAWRVLNAADFGAPTHRRRLFLVARNDGEPIVWPDPTHGDPKKIGRDLFSGTLKPWRTAAECIDWSIPCPSIFERKTPLRPNTLRRIALGIKRYVLDNPQPFIVGVGGRAGQSPPTPADAPIGTVTAKNDRAVVVPVVSPLLVRFNTEKGPGENNAHSLDAPFNTVTADPRFGLITPFVAPVTHAGERRAHPPTEPMPTVTGANRGEYAVVSPLLVDMQHQNKARAADEPLGTVTTQGNRFNLVTPFLARACQTGGNGKYTNEVTEPLTTVVSKAEHMLIAPVLDRQFGKSAGAPVDGPLGTITAGGKGKSALVSAFIAKHYGGYENRSGVAVDTPLPTTTARGTQNQLVAANLVHLNHGDKTSSGVDEPARTVTAGGNHAALVYSFLTKYFGTGGQWQRVDDPLHTATSKARFGLVTVTIDGQPYAIVDIGMRMIKPRELARAQGFPESYLLTGSITNQVERIGNSVSPPCAEALVRANYARRRVRRSARRKSA